MKTLFFAVLLASVSFAACADTYQLTFGWTDPTSYNPSDTPTYEAEHRVSGGTVTSIVGLATSGGSASVDANPGEPLEVRVRAENQGLYSPWTAWAVAAAPYPVTMPVEQTGLTITVTRLGP